MKALLSFFAFLFFLGLTTPALALAEYPQPTGTTATVVFTITKPNTTHLNEGEYIRQRQAERNVAQQSDAHQKATVTPAEKKVKQTRSTTRRPQPRKRKMLKSDNPHEQGEPDTLPLEDRD